MSFEVEGKLHKKFDTENKTDTFQAREFVLEVSNGNYPQLVKFQLVQDRCSVLDPFEEGEMIKVHFDLRGREWNGKFFTKLNAWRIEKAGAAATPSPSTGFDSSFPTVADEPGGGGNFSDADNGNDPDDDLPF